LIENGAGEELFLNPRVKKIADTIQERFGEACRTQGQQSFVGVTEGDKIVISSGFFDRLTICISPA